MNKYLPFAWDLTFAPYTGGQSQDQIVDKFTKADKAEAHAKAHQAWRNDVWRKNTKP